MHSGFLEGVQLPEKCTNSSEMSVNVSVQLEMTHILSSTTIISLVYSKMCFCNQFTGALWFFRGGKMVRNSKNSIESSSEMAVQVSVQLEMTIQYQ